MAGLSAGCFLVENGWTVELLEKGRGVGGRVATRRVTNAAGAIGRIDHGAQFYTAREEPLATWAQQFGCRWWIVNGHVRYRGEAGMNEMAKHFAESLTIYRERRVQRLEQNDGWLVHTECGERYTSDAVILTAPVPQALDILRVSGIPFVEDLQAVEYDPCLAVLAVLKQSTGWSLPGVQEPESGPVAWVADNQVKGVSPIPTATLHATPEFSEEHFRGDREAAGQIMLDAVDLDVESYTVHGWLYARPRETYPDFAPQVCDAPPLFLAGDAFYAPRVEGAVMSGLGAAERLVRLAK